MAKMKLKSRVKTNGKKQVSAPKKRAAKPIPNFVYYIHIAATPEKVWEALTDNQYIPRYFFGFKIQSDWEAGSELLFLSEDGKGSDHGIITRLEPHKVLAYTFEWPSDKLKRTRPTEVKFEILPMLGGVKLMLTHTHLLEGDTMENPFTLGGLNNGWPAIVSNLKSVLETGKGILDMSQMATDGSLKLPKKDGSYMSLTTEPQTVKWPPTHFVFIEKVGPFMETAKQAWDSLLSHVPKIMEHNKITGFMALYKFKPDTYRAGIAVAAKPKKLPEGFSYEPFKGGPYAKWVLTGSYSDLPEACGYVFEKLLPEKKIKMRQGWCIENYTNDPNVTPEKDLVTEILVPVA